MKSMSRMSNTAAFSTPGADEAEASENQCEVALLGAILTSSATVLPQVASLRPDDFYYPMHADIYQAAQTVHERGENATPFTVAPHLKATAAFHEMGGEVKYMMHCVKNAGACLYPADYARLLHEFAQKRRIAAACSAVAGKADFNNDAEPETLIAELIEQLSDIGKASASKAFSTAIEVTQQIIDDMNAGTAEPDSTGLLRLDKAMEGGLHAGRFYGFAARKKGGKTALAATISANLNARGVKHLFICGEMDDKEIQKRVLARYTHSYPSAFRNEYGKSAAFQQKLSEAMANIKEHALYENAPGLSFADLKRICTVAVDRHKVRGIILDYFQLVGGIQKNQTKAAHLDEVAQWLASFGRKHGVWMFTLVQINQEGNTRDGEGIRLACDQLFELHREDPSRPEAWLEMLETRHTAWCNLGDKGDPGLLLNDKGPFFEEVPLPSTRTSRAETYNRRCGND